jgi:hypothetical protein
VPPEPHRRLFGGNLFKKEVIDLFTEQDWDIYSNEDELMQHFIEKNGFKINKTIDCLVHHKSSFNRYGGIDANVIILRMNDNKWISISEGIFKRKNQLGLGNFMVFSFYLPVRLFFYLNGKSFWRIMGYIFPDYYMAKLRLKMSKCKYIWAEAKQHD